MPYDIINRNKWSALPYSSSEKSPIYNTSIHIELKIELKFNISIEF